MGRFAKRPFVIDAFQWFKNGDHPDDNCFPIKMDDGYQFNSEGKVVRYFRHPDVLKGKVCEKCSCEMEKHGWIDTLEGGHIVCPGDWIITGVKGEHYPCKPDIFDMTYESVD